MLCPCHSQKLYESCCRPFHEGKQNAVNALALMRSRYSAYALGKASYLISTTHPSNPLFKQKPQERISSIMQFCQQTSFEDLEILEFIDGENTAYVTFKAILRQNSRDASFIEKSLFQKVNGCWLYVRGVFPE